MAQSETPLQRHKAAGDRVVTYLLRQLLASLDAEAATLYLPSRDKDLWIAAFVARSMPVEPAGGKEAVLTLDETQWPLARALRGVTVVLPDAARGKFALLVPLMRQGKSHRVRPARRRTGGKHARGGSDRRIHPNAVLSIEGVKMEVAGASVGTNAIASPRVPLSPVVQGLIETTGAALAELLSARRDRRTLKAHNRALARRMRNLPHEVESQRRVAEGLRDILVVLNSDRNLPGILDYLVRQARTLMDADACVLYRLDRDQQNIVIEAQAALPASLAGVGELPLDLSGPGPQVFRGLILSETPITRSDLAWRDRQTTNDVAVASEAVLSWMGALSSSYASLLSVPLWVKGAFYGNLGLYYLAARAFSESDVSLALNYASQAALAIENARLRLQAEQAAVLQERGRLARDLHDSVTQSLYSLTLLAEAARRLAGAGDVARVESAITRLGEIGQQALKEMRLLVYELRPLVLRREGLLRALGLRMETVERRAGVDAQLVVEGDLALSPALEEQLYHLIQEALNNALKHSGASVVMVRLDRTGERLRVEIADNGRGFDLEHLGHEGGMGLVSMRERVERLEGAFVVETHPGEGTRIVVMLEVPPYRPGVRESARASWPDNEGDQSD